MASWIKSSTYPGIRYREHETRTTGIGKNKRPDRYITIFYKLDGKMVQEVCGWASKGVIEKDANELLAELQKNQRTGIGPRTLKEKRELAETARKEQAAKELEQAAIEAQAAKDNQTLTAVFYEQYLPQAKQDRRNKASWIREECLFRLWIAPEIGSKPLKDVAAFHLEHIKKAMKSAGQAPRSIQYALAVVRQIFSHCYNGKNPAAKEGKVKRPKFDNKRTRYLTRIEAKDLLAELATVSQDVHDMALLSLHTGMRAGEVFNLTWADVDFGNGVLMLMNTKSSKNRAAYMTATTRVMLMGRPKNSALVFPNRRNGGKIVQVSDTFNFAVKKLGLNDGVTDRLNKVSFHTLRHTFASWLVEAGTDLYYIKELLGHSTIALTERYAHVGENALKAAVQRLEVKEANG